MQSAARRSLTYQKIPSTTRENYAYKCELSNHLNTEVSGYDVLVKNELLGEALQ